MYDQFGKWKDVGLHEHQDPYQASQRDAVEEDVTQDVPLMAIPFRRRAGDDDALRIYHFAHHAATTVGRGHQRRREAT